ncbi:hypothetical protein H0S58_13005 [Acinetobacter sp. TTH0-4]|nr:hypothetical protein H0S58_13005 [Acinetobacter sp. TTH0-4]
MPKNYFNSLSVIPSAFQKRVVEYDFNHNLLKSLENLEFDVLLMDLIDERFHLAIFETKYRVTRSNEFLKTNLKPGSVLNSHTEQFMKFWTQGIDLFFERLKSKNMLDKVRIQRAYWSNNLDNGLKIETYTDDVIRKENVKLDHMYIYLEKYLSPEQFISIPSELLLIKADHQWGVSPFHFIDDYYKYLVQHIFS